MRLLDLIYGCHVCIHVFIHLAETNEHFFATVFLPVCVQRDHIDAQMFLRLLHNVAMKYLAICNNSVHSV